MALVRTILSDTAECTLWRDEDPAVGYVGYGRDWKPGSTGYNNADLRSKTAAALQINATYLALATPTTAQNTAQVQRLTRECSALIRLLLGRLEDVSGT